MRIICKKGEFELHPDFRVQYHWNNVVLLDAGEQTQPIVLPGTAHNLRLIEYSNRIDNIYKPITDLEVFVIDGALHRSCNMGIHSADDEDGISCTLYFDSGGFYSRLRNTRMQWLSWKMVRHPDFANVNQDTRVQFLIDLLKSEYNAPRADADFCFAPVRTSQEFTWRVKIANHSGVMEDADVAELFCLNDFEKYQHQHQISRATIFNPSPSGWSTTILNTFAGEYRQKQIISGVEANIEKGYGMTPFLKLRYILDFIFTRFGYTFDHQQLSSELTGYNNICVLNNVADAIYAGVLNYRQLVPDTTIKEFLDVVQTMLAGSFVFDEVRKTVHFYFYQDVLKRSSDHDLTPYLAGRAKMGQPEFTTINLVDSKTDAFLTGTETTEDVTEIELKLVNPVEFFEPYFYTNIQTVPVTGPEIVSSRFRFNFTRKIVETGGIVHLNSGIVINNETREESTKSMVDVFFVYINTNIREISAFVFQARDINSVPGLNLPPMNVSVNIPYKTSYRMFYEDEKENDLVSIKDLYVEYIEFRKNSNIPVTAKMNIPQTDLFQLNINTPKALNGQTLMIESVENVSGEPTQQVNFRTLRQYLDKNNVPSPPEPPIESETWLLHYHIFELEISMRSNGEVSGKFQENLGNIVFENMSFERTDNNLKIDLQFLFAGFRQTQEINGTISGNNFTGTALLVFHTGTSETHQVTGEKISG